MQKAWHQYDITLKCLTGQFPVDYIKFIIGDYKGDFEVLPLELPVVSTKEPDFLVKIKDTKGEFILHLEFQTKHEEEIPRRMLFYYSRILEIYKSERVYQVVIYLNPKDANIDLPNSYKREFKDLSTYHYYKVLKIWEVDQDLILKNNLYGLYPLLSIIEDSKVKDSFERIEKTSLDETTKANLYLCAILLSELKYPKDLIKRILKEDLMIQSQILNEYIEKGIEKSKREFIKEGIEKGKKEGKLERLKKDVISVLRARFTRVPRRVTTKIKTIKKETRLEQLLKLAAISKDLGEFEKNLE